MIKTITISTMEELFEHLLSEQKYQEHIDRYRNEYLYRGIPDADYKLETSLQRNCKEHQQDLEPSIIRNFMKYASIEDPAIERSVWRQLILGAHHGLPTRMLDWSQSPLIGLHFACTENHLEKMDQHDCAIWKIDVREIHSLLPNDYSAVLDQSKSKYFSVDTLSKIAPDLTHFDDALQNKAICILEPPSIDHRIVNQYSFFSIIPMGVENIEKYLDENTSNTTKFIIKKEIRWRIRDMLDQQNISERIVYPGLDGLSKWLARHYYVKEKKQ